MIQLTPKMQASYSQLLAGKYLVERELGRGGMGVVVAARHIQLDEKVAIKFLLPEAVSNAEVIERFVREARAAVRIKSEHVARVSDVGNLEGGEPYMVMEYLEGSDLAAWLQEQGALPVEQAVEFVLQASEAIAEAHALGIVHRDLKPANLFVVRRADGLLSIKVLDFGISKVSATGASGSDANLTRTAAIMGSPLYMPPEQLVASRGVDARADIWALGVILYELVAGQPPFSGETLTEICSKIAIQAPRAIRDFRADVPLALETILLRCLEKDRERRYPNVAELAHALVAFGPSRSRSSVERITRTIEAAGLSARPPAAPVSSHGIVSSRSRMRGPALIVGTTLLLGLAGLAIAVKHGRSSQPPSDAVSTAVARPISVAPRAPEPVMLPVPALALPASSSFPQANPLPLGALRSATAKHPAPTAATAPLPRPATTPSIFDDR